jgi:hypothetical protein
VPHVEDEWKVPLISYRGEEVEVVGRGSLGLPVLRLPRPPHLSSTGLVFPPKFRPEGKQGFGSVFMCNGSGSSILGKMPIRIQIQSGSRVFMPKNKKKIQLKIFIYFFWIKKYNITPITDIQVT